MEIRKLRSRWQRGLLRGLVQLVLWQKAIRERVRPRPPMRGEPARIALFASMELLGGGIIISAIAKALRSLYPRARIYVVGEQHRAGTLAEFYRDHSCVDELIICPPRDGSRYRDWWRFYRQLTRFGFELAVLSPNHSCADPVFLYLLGIPEIYGAYLPKTWVRHLEIENRFLTRMVTTEHMGEEPYRLLAFPREYVRMVLHRPDARLGELVPFIAPRGESPPAPAPTPAPAPARAMRRPRVVLHPGGAPHRRWPVERYAAIAQRLVQRRGASIAIIGGAPERALGATLQAEIARLCPDSIVENCCGCSLDETVRVVSEAVLYVGNNAGPMQIAVAVGTPVVGVFLQLDRHFSGPDAAGDEHAVVARERIEDVSVDDVWQAIEPRARTARVS